MYHPHLALGEDGSPKVSEYTCIRCWEVQKCEMHGNSVRRWLNGCLAFRKEELGAPPWIRDIIENGYFLPLFNEPTP